jgi:transposase InsO family protein
MAIENRRPNSELIVHADHGTQFTSWAFTDSARHSHERAVVERPANSPGALITRSSADHERRFEVRRLPTSMSGITPW